MRLFLDTKIARKTAAKTFSEDPGVRTEGWSDPAVRKGWDNWGSSAWKRVWGDPTVFFQYLRGASRRMDRKCLGGTGVTE